MDSNNTLRNDTEIVCDINSKLIKNYWFFTSIACSLLSFVGNVFVILIVCTTKTMRTTTNCFIANMALSDLFVPVLDMFYNVLFTRIGSPLVKQGLGTALCKITSFLFNTSYGVSMASLVLITGHRFYAVAFPMKTSKIQSVKVRKILLLCTWLGPTAMCSPFLRYSSYNPKNRDCYNDMARDLFLLWNITFFSLFVAVPFIVMFILYPMIVLKLVKQKIPGNFNSRTQKRRFKQNASLTKMFITIIIVILLTYGSYQIVYVTTLFSESWCRAFKKLAVVYPFPNIFHVVNPLIYFIFCSAYRKRIKQMFSCCFGEMKARRD